ncbi:MAG: hypothetical protein GVY14_00975 [Spirochaetes bacterium]|jgi:hypothetical protein|nr:hypothetical protein [Spirochaetota bacterium]
MTAGDVSLRRLLGPLHGERPSSTQLYLIHVPALGIGLAIAGPTALGGNAAGIARGLLILLLFWHLAAGFIAHTTRSLNEYYRRRPRLRAAVGPIHLLHVTLVALVFETDGMYVFFTAAFSVAAAMILNAIYGDDNQKPAAAVVLGVGFAAHAFLLSPPPELPWFGYLLLLKLLAGYAPDHYPPRDDRMWWT